MDLHEHIIALLDHHKARYRKKGHAPEGQTDKISAIRGNPLSQAAKTWVVQVIGRDHAPAYWLIVIAGDRRLNFQKVRQTTGSRRSPWPSPDQSQGLTQAEVGAIPPFSFHADLGLIVDHGLCAESEIVFNAGRLDRSIFLAMDDYLRIAQPRVLSVADTKDRRVETNSVAEVGMLSGAPSMELSPMVSVARPVGALRPCHSGRSIGPCTPCLSMKSRDLLERHIQ